MPRVLLLTAVALCATVAHAQSGMASVQAFFDENGPREGDGALTVVGPVLADYAETGDATESLALEAGVEYMIVIVTPDGQGLDPDVYVYDAAMDMVASGIEVAERELLFFTPEEGGSYTIEFSVLGDGAALPYGYAIYRPDD